MSVLTGIISEKELQKLIHKLIPRDKSLEWPRHDKEMKVVANTVGQQIEIAEEGTLVATRKRINFKDGTSIDITVADVPPVDSTGDNADVTIALGTIEQNLIPDTTVTRDIGSGLKRFRDVFGQNFKTHTVNLSTFAFQAYNTTTAAYENLLSAIAGTPPILRILSRMEISDFTDTTKLAKFDAAGITTGNTRTLTVQDASGKILIDSLDIIPDLDITRNIGSSVKRFNNAWIDGRLDMTGGNIWQAGYIDIGNAGDIRTGEFLTNYHLKAWDTVEAAFRILMTVQAADPPFLQFTDGEDQTKTLVFDWGTTVGARTLTIPNGDGTFALIALAQILTNKTVDADLNTITNIEDADMKAHANTKITALTGMSGDIASPLNVRIANTGRLRANSGSIGIQVGPAVLTVGSLGSIILPVDTVAGAPTDVEFGDQNGAVAWNSADKKFYIRDAVGTYTEIGAGGGGGGGGWTDDGTIVRLTTAADQVSIGNLTPVGSENLHVRGSSAGTIIDIWNTRDSSSNQVAIFRGNDRIAGGQTNDDAYISFYLDDSTGASAEFAQFLWKAIDPLSTSKDTELRIKIMDNNLLATRWAMSPTGVAVNNENPQFSFDGRGQIFNWESTINADARFIFRIPEVVNREGAFKFARPGTGEGHTDLFADWSTTMTSIPPTLKGRSRWRINIGNSAQNVFHLNDNEVANLTRCKIMNDVPSSPSAMGTNVLEVENTNATFGGPLVLFDQDDIDQPYVNFEGTVAANAVNSLSSFTTGNTIQGFIQIQINGVKRWIAHYNDPTA